MGNFALAHSQVAAVALMLTDCDDEQLKLDTLEGQTDLFELERYLLGKVEDDEGVIASLAVQIEDRQTRKKAAETRKERRRDAMKALLECAKLDKLVLPEATLSVRDVPPKAIVNDPEAVPDELCKIKRSPDMAAIKAEMESGRAVPGVTLDNGAVSLTIRRK